MSGIFGGVEKSAWPVLDLSFDPFPFKDDNGFGGFGVTMGGDDGAWGKAAKEEASPGDGVMRKVGEFYPRIRTWFPEGGIGEASGGEHKRRMPREFLLTISGIVG